MAEQNTPVDSLQAPPRRRKTNTSYAISAKPRTRALHKFVVSVRIIPVHPDSVLRCQSSHVGIIQRAYNSVFVFGEIDLAFGIKVWESQMLLARQTLPVFAMEAKHKFGEGGLVVDMD